MNHSFSHVPGITIGHVLRCNPKPERWKLKLYIPMLVCFFLGAATGKAAFDVHGRASLLWPTFFLFALGWGYIYFLAHLRRQPFHRVLLKRVSNEILTPHSPSHNRKLHTHMMGLPHINIPFMHGRLHPQQQQHHGRRHSSACDELSKSKPEGGGTAPGDSEQQIVLDIGAPPAPVPASGEGNEISNTNAAVV